MFKSTLCFRPLNRILNKNVTFKYMNITHFSTDNTKETDTHSDFAPQRKVVPEGMDDVMKLIDTQVKDNKVMLFMKGTPSKPQCGFSGQVIRLLHAMGVEFSSINVMEFPTIREGIKSYS